MTSIYLNGVTQSRSADSSARMREGARAAFGLLGRDLNNAGYAPIVSADPANTINFQGLAFQVCQRGFVNVHAPNLVCKTQGNEPPAFAVRYHVTDVDKISTFEGRDCQGNRPTESITTNLFAVRNVYSIQDDNGLPTLFCASDGQNLPLIGGVENMRIRVALGDKSSGLQNSVLSTTDATVDSTTPTTNTVLTVSICLLMVAEDSGTSSGSYVDCDGLTQTATSGKLRRAFHNSFSLRNNVEASPLVASS